MFEEEWPMLIPNPVVLISSIDKDGRPNVMTCSWCGVCCTSPPLVQISIRPYNYTNKCLKETMEMVVAVPPDKLIDKVLICGSASGKYVDKVSLCQFELKESELVKPYCITQCIINMECKIVDVRNLGSHDMFIGHVLKVHHLLDTINHKVNEFREDLPLVYCTGNRSFYKLGEKLSRRH